MNARQCALSQEEVETLNSTFGPEESPEYADYFDKKPNFPEVPLEILDKTTWKFPRESSRSRDEPP